jgi:hypothetical protein
LEATEEMRKMAKANTKWTDAKASSLIAEIGLGGWAERLELARYIMSKFGNATYAQEALKSLGVEYPRSYTDVGRALGQPSLTELVEGLHEDLGGQVCSTEHRNVGNPWGAFHAACAALVRWDNAEKTHEAVSRARADEVVAFTLANARVMLIEEFRPLVARLTMSPEQIEAADARRAKREAVSDGPEAVEESTSGAAATPPDPKDAGAALGKSDPQRETVNVTDPHRRPAPYEPEGKLSPSPSDIGAIAQSVSEAMARLRRHWSAADEGLRERDARHVAKVLHAFEVSASTLRSMREVWEAANPEPEQGPEQDCPRCGAVGDEPCSTANGGPASRRHADRPLVDAAECEPTDQLARV